MAATAESARGIYKAAAVTDRHELRIEDLYYVGILRQKVGLKNPKSINDLEWSRGTVTYWLHITVITVYSDHPKETLCLHYPDISYPQIIHNLEAYKKGKLSIRNIAS